MRVNERMKKVFSILLCLCMVLQYVPTTAFAATTAEDGLCAHHTEHTPECGYVEAVAGSDCTHVHDELCGYAEAVAEVLCACTADENSALVHTEGCGYVAPVAASDCTHSHDDNCGYLEAVAGNDCAYECAECAEALTADETTEPSTEPAPVCTCGTDDDTIHATNCLIYVAPENPQCFCEQKCGVETQNFWCDICGFDVTACQGSEEEVDTTFDNGYTVTVQACENGTVSADKNTAAAGETVTLAVEANTGNPDKGYIVSSICVDYGDNLSIFPELQPNGTYTFIMPANNVTVTATFEEAEIYPLWVGGKQAVGNPDANGDIYICLKEKPGSITYNPQSNTLTLNSATIRYVDPAGGGSAIYYCGSETLNLVLNGTNTLGGGSYEIHVGQNSLNISGSGSLYNFDGTAVVISSNINMTISDSVHVKIMKETQSSDRYCTLGKGQYRASPVGGPFTACEENTHFDGLYLEFIGQGHTITYTQDTNDPGKHTLSCSCGLLNESSAHTGGTPTCTEQAKCEIRGISYGEADAGNHTYFSDVCCGTCGENAKWALTGGTLTISGTGAMTDFPYVTDADNRLQNGAPWKDSLNAITSVVIESGITTIGARAFYQCVALRSVDIPQSVTAIGDFAFYGSGLTSANLPATVKTIGFQAFSECAGLTNVTLHKGLEKIDHFAFSRSGLTSLTIPEGVKTLGRDLVDGCTNLKTIRITGDSPSVDSNLLLGVAPNTTVYIYGKTASGYEKRGWQNENATLVFVDKITAVDIVVSQTYTGQAFEPTVTVTNYKGETLTNGTDYTVTYSDNVNAGTAKVTVTGAGSYGGTLEARFSIAPKPITVTAEAKSKTYGDADPTLTYTVNGLVAGDELTGTLARAEGENVGSYNITIGTLGNDNYNITFNGAKLTINAKAITEADVKLNGSLTYNGKEQTQPITVTEGITYEVTGNKATNAGEYELTVTGTDNYTGSVRAKWSIAKAAVTITADNKVIYIGEELPSLTYTVSGLMDGDELTKVPTLTTNADEKLAGSYTIAAANADAEDNYEIFYVSGTLTIMDKETEVETKIEKTELTEVPDGLKNTEFNTVEAITEEMISRILATSNGFAAEYMEHYDVMLQFSLDGGDTWILATEENFPTEGITVTLPYPEGTNPRDYEFVVSHMFTVTSQRLGTTAGDVELPKVEETANGIRVTLNGLSPVTVAARYHDHTGGTATCTDKAVCSICGNAYGELNSTNHAGGTEVKDAKEATCGAEGYTGDTCCKGCGEALEKGSSIKAAGDHTYGNWKVVKEATKTAKGEKQRTCSVCGHVDSEEIPMIPDIPATGDDSNIMLYASVFTMSLAAIVVLLLDSKKRKQENA